MKVWLVLVFSQQIVVGCQICLPFPQKSLLDKINAAEAVVLAREDSKKSYHLSVVKWLKKGGASQRLDVYLPSQLRRTLKTYPERSLLCLQTNGVWSNAGVYVPELDEIISDLIDNQWGDDKQMRAQFFAGYLGHKNQTISRLAHIEVARAPYALLRSIEHSLSEKQLIELLSDQRMEEWHALYILLLAQQGGGAAAEFIKERFKICQEHHFNSNLAAWTLAFIEVENQALDLIEQFYIEQPGRGPREMAGVISALSTYAECQPECRDRVAALYLLALQTHSSLLLPIVNDLKRWQQWAAAEGLSEQVKEWKEELGAEDRSALHAYFSAAEDQQRVKKKGSSPVWMLGLLLIALLILYMSKRTKRDR